MTRRPLAFATLLALAATAACSPAEESTDQPSGKPTAGIPPVATKAKTTATAAPAADPFPSPSPSPSPIEGVVFPPAPKNETAEQRAIREGWEAYETQFDRYGRDSDLNDYTELADLTTGSETEYVINAILKNRDAGVVRVGQLTFRGLVIDEAHTNEQSERIATLEVCKDFTQQKKVVEKTGGEFHESGTSQAPTLLITYVMQRHPNGDWVVASGEGKATTC